MLELMLFVVMSLLQHHVLDLHKSDLGASLILIKLHAYILYSLPGLRDDDMLNSIYIWRVGRCSEVPLGYTS